MALTCHPALPKMAPVDRSRRMIGKTLGHYRILEKVAAGGMGVVYLARDEQLERDVAVKVLPSGTLTDETARRHFRKEATSLAKLNHPHIETVYDFGNQDGVDFLVMEYVPGKTLAERLSAGALSEKEIIELGIQIASALEEAHDRGIVHRDLKPANIALTARGYAKILDFGLAKLLRPVEEGTTEVFSDSQAAAGTLPYMPPEQLKGERVDGRADIYTVGAVLYEMATSRRAFREELASRLIDAILHQPVVPPRAFNSRISPDLESIILKCLDKDPDQRYQSAKELLVDLRRLRFTSPRVAVAPLPASKSKRMWKRIGYGIAGLLALIAVLVGLNVGRWRDRLLGRPRTPQIRSLAVLPFENLSGSAEQDYFAEGMTEALINSLGQIQALRVISRTSVMRYKSPQKPLRQIAEELRVDGIVEGATSLIGGVVQVDARLLYGPTDTLLWSGRYNRQFQNVLTLQAELASAIFREIDLTLTPQEQAQLASSAQVNPAAHEAYLKGNFLKRGTPEQREKSKEYFEEAIRVDPNYAPAYAGLADYYRSSSELAPLVGMRESERYARKALELDPALAHAHLALGSVRFFGDWNWPAADVEFSRALKLNPNDAEAHRTYANFLAALGRQAEAQSEIHRAQELDPLYITTRITAGWVDYFARQYNQAIEECHAALELDPNSAGGYDCLGGAYLAQGSSQQAIEACQKAARLSENAPARTVGLGEAYARGGRKAEAKEVLQQMRDRARRAYVSPVFVSRLYLASGDHKQALAQLEQAYRDHDPYVVWLKVEPAFDPLRTEAGFQDLLGRVGFPQ